MPPVARNTPHTGWADFYRDAHGMPCVFDPAVSGGSRELDLAMMRLFGGFLVHVAIFGAGYVAQTAGCLHTILRK